MGLLRILRLGVAEVFRCLFRIPGRVRILCLVLEYVVVTGFLLVGYKCVVLFLLHRDPLVVLGFWVGFVRVIGWLLFLMVYSEILQKL